MKIPFIPKVKANIEKRVKRKNVVNSNESRKQREQEYLKRLRNVDGRR